MGVLTIWHRKQPIAMCVSENVDVKYSLSQARTRNFSLEEGMADREAIYNLFGLKAVL
jgi:hypothetical protein